MSKNKNEPITGNQKEDVETNELEEMVLPAEELEKPINPREAAMQRVVNDSADTRREAYKAEGEVHPEDKELADPVIVDDLDVEEPPPEPIEPEIVDNSDDLDNTPIVKRDGQTFVKVKIAGVEQEVPVDDMVTHYQKNENADAKLGEANQMLNQARTLQQSQASTLPDDSHRPVVDETAVNAALNKLYDGDVDEAAKEMTQLLSNQPAPQVDISTQVAQEVARQADHNNLKSSFDRFSKNEAFKHIVSDQTLMGKVDDFTVALQQDQAFMATNPSYEDIFNEAGKRTNEWVESLAPTKATEEIIEERRDRKLAKPQAVNSRTARRGPKPEKKAPTREDSLAKMASARGQTIYN